LHFATPRATLGCGMLFGPLSLQGKINTIIATAVVLIVVVSTYIALLLTRGPVEEEIYRKTLLQARSTAQQLTETHKLEDTARLDSALRQMQREFPGVKQAEVYLHSPVHTLLATTDVHGPHVELDRTPGIEQFNEFEQPNRDQMSIETADGAYWIFGTSLRSSQDHPIGCLVLRVSKSRSNVVTWALVKQNLLLMLGSLAVLILVIHIFFLKSVREPVNAMIRVMEATEGGQLNARAEVASRDEIGELARHLNLMLGRIENFHAELARQVKNATAELARANEELKQINQELFATQKNLARSERLAVAGQLAASLAHEIGNPLNSISGHVQLLARRKSMDDGAQRRLQIIEKQIENIVRTVKQLLSWTRHFELKMEPVDLRRLVKESALLSGPALHHRGIKVQMDLPRDCPPVEGDPGYLQHVLLNLINNSMDAMPGGGELKLRLRYPANGQHDQVAIEVSDTGCGIEPEALAHIFEPMFTTKHLGTGAGLGLAICDQIVRQHSGSIRVESQRNRGTCFTITLPVCCRERTERVLETADSVRR
jgi:two-component system NtrC family sensor kinase